MKSAALTLSVLSIVTCSCCYLSIPMGALAIVFALLSRGGKMQLDSKMKLCILLALVGILLTTLLREACELYGMDYEALYGDMFR